MQPSKHLYIDSLRGIAILLVLLVHARFLSSDSTYFPAPLLEIIDSGQMGVQLFFVVSAYTLMASFYSRKSELFKTRNFFIRRSFRIAPMYYIAIIYFSFQNFIGFDYFFTGKMEKEIPLGRLLSNISFTNGFNPYWINNYVPGGWSIAIEMIFYLCLPFLCRFIKNVNSASLLFCGSLICAAILEQLLHYTFLHTNEYLFYYFPNQLSVFSLGILAFFVVRDGVLKLGPATVAFLAVTAFIFSFAQLSIHIALSIGYFLLLVTLAKKQYKLISNNLFAAIGKVSFSMYLVHFAVMYWMTYLGLNNLIEVNNFSAALLALGIRFSILFGCSFLVSSLTYKLIELPFQKTGAKLIAMRLPASVFKWMPGRLIARKIISANPTDSVS